MKKNILFSFVLLLAFAVYAQNRPNELVEVHYDNDNFTGIGTANADLIIAAKFTQEILAPFVGKALAQVKVYIYNATKGDTGILRIYGPGTLVTPGELLYSSPPVHVDSNSWNIIPVSEFVTIPASDLWVGFEARSGPSGSHSWAGCDSGPNNPDGQYIYLSDSWFRLTALGAAFTYNWNIRAVIDPTTHIKNEVSPTKTILKQNYPNPFNPNTTITFSLACQSWVNIKVYNIIGKEVSVLFDNSANAGDHTVIFNASGLPGGMYLYKLTASGINGSPFTSVKKMLLLK